MSSTVFDIENSIFHGFKILKLRFAEATRRATWRDCVATFFI